MYEQVKHQISGTAIGTKFAPTYASIFMDEISFWYGSDISMMFSSFGHMGKKLEEFLKKISITTTPTLNLPMSSI